MKLQEHLTELGYVEVSDNVWKGTGSDGKSDVYVGIHEDGKVELVKQPHEQDIPAILISFSKDCDVLLDAVERWTWI